MITYIKKNIPGKYVTMETELDNTLHTDIGSTYEQYLNNWWVLLSDEQVKFHEVNPDASVKEVINMELVEKHEVDLLVEAKNKVLNKIQEYDQSNAVNNFILNGQINAWFTPAERNNYKASVDAAKLLGETTLDFLINDMPFTITVEGAEYVLAQIQRYADKCFIVTAQHKANVNSLTAVEEVELYDYTTGYPEMLKFELA